MTGPTPGQVPSVAQTWPSVLKSFCGRSRCPEAVCRTRYFTGFPPDLREPSVNEYAFKCFSSGLFLYGFLMGHWWNYMFAAASTFAHGCRLSLERKQQQPSVFSQYNLLDVEKQKNTRVFCLTVEEDEPLNLLATGSFNGSVSSSPLTWLYLVWKWRHKTVIKSQDRDVVEW